MSFQELKRQVLAKGAAAIRCGATDNPNRRKNEYSENGYFGVMMYSQVSDMKKAENELLAMKDWPRNKERHSNKHPNESGYVYFIYKNNY